MRVSLICSTALGALLALAGLGAGAQCVSLTTVGAAATQNFDTLAIAGTTNNLTITGWFLTETGGGARDNEQYAFDNGGSNTGDTYSYGTTAATERALGGLQSGTLIPVIGACFTNNTGTTLASLDVAYTGEQWRLGTAARTDQLDFQFSLNATSLATGTWTDVNALDFVSPFTTTTGARDGNAAGNRTALSSSITGQTIANGATFWVRWNDANASGADDGLAVDDFSLTPQAGVVLPNLSINDVSLAEGNAGVTNFTFTVSLSAPAGAGGVTFDIAAADNTATVAGSDFAANILTGQTIPAGNQTFDFTVVVNGDTLLEANETFFVNVTNIVGATPVDAQGLGTISNDDAPPSVSFALESSSIAEGNVGNTNHTVVVNLSAPSSLALELNFSTFDGGGMNADATNPSDYLSTSGTLSFPPNVTTANIVVPIVGDTTIEPNEDFTIGISPPFLLGVGSPEGLADEQVVTILNDEADPVASITVAPATMTETPGPPLIYSVTLTPAPSVDTTINFTVSGSATSGSDFIDLAATSVTILANQTTENMVVAAIDDALAGEPDETVVITLAAGTGYTVAGAPGDSATGTIQDNDSAEVSIAVAPASVQEDDVTSLTYTVSVTNASVNPITVPLTFSGSATSGVDYTGTQASVTFPANSAAAQTVVIDPTADATVEADETVIVTLEAGAGYAVNAGSGSATGSITNDDVSADLSYTITDSPDPVNTGGQVTYTVTVTNAGPTPAGNVQMSFQIPAGMTFVSLAAPGGWTCTTVPVGSGGGVGCFSASVAVGTSVFSIVAAVPPTSPAGTVFSASGDVTSPTFDPAPGNNAAAIGTTVVGGPQAIPGLDPFGRLMLVLGMLLLVGWRVRNH